MDHQIAAGASGATGAKCQIREMHSITTGMHVAPT